MGIDDRIDAVREDEKAQIDEASRRVAEEEEVRRRRADEHRTKAEALMPEVSEGVRLLRSKQERSAQLLGDSWTPMRLAWQLGPGWTEKRRRERRKMIGWVVETRVFPEPEGPPSEKAFPAHEVFIPLDGRLRVADKDTRETLDGHVRAGIVDVPVTHDKVTTTAEVHADKTVSAFLDLLARHLALLD